MTSFPHNLVLDIQPRFGPAQSTFLNLSYLLINWRILMKFVSKCLAFVSLSYQVRVKVCNPIPLSEESVHDHLNRVPLTNDCLNL